MELIKWTDDLKLNIESIDQQHKKLVDMINDFYAMIAKKSNKELIAKLIKDMKEYTVDHFETEEAYFRQYDFEGFAEHKAEHQDFVDKVIDLENRYLNGRLILSFEITNFLKAWITNHIQGSDAQYVDLLKSKGVA